MPSFFEVKTSEEVHAIIDRFAPVGEEQVELETADGRVLSRPILSPEDLPAFSRSSMDGFAVRAQDTFGASESLPALVEVIGEVPMGQTPALEVGAGQALRIWTGGMLPRGADAVVMIEYCHDLDERTIEVARTVAPLENVIQTGDDIRRDSRVLAAGHRLRPQDMGLLAGLGIRRLWAHRRPRIGIISTGDEIVPIEAELTPGKVRDVNRYTLQAFCRALGAAPVYLGMCRDDLEALKRLVAQGLESTDSVWISGGSSVGMRDLTLAALEALPAFELLVHGIAISPGKPTIVGRAGAAPLIGLPGHVASAMVVAQVFMARLLRRLAGETRAGDDPSQLFLTAELSRNVASASGREDYIRVRLARQGTRWLAEPVYGKSGLIGTLVEADGLVRIDRNTEGLYQGQEVKVWIFQTSAGGSL